MSKYKYYVNFQDYEENEMVCYTVTVAKRFLTKKSEEINRQSLTNCKMPRKNANWNRMRMVMILFVLVQDIDLDS